MRWYIAVFRRLWVALFLALALLSASAAHSAEPEFRLATFSADVTVPIGHRLMGILPARAARVADPLEARGFVLLGADKPIVWVAVDWCEIRNEAYDRWREILAAAAGTEPARVIVTCLHQHDAPVADLGAQRLLEQVGLANQLCDAGFHEEAVRRVAGAVGKSLPSARPVTHIGIGKGLVQNVASNRRVALGEGRVSFGRGSNSGSDPAMQQAPEGLIDPWLRTMSFWNGDEPLLALHTYATHPMSYYGRGEVSADFVGLARRLRQEEEPAVFQIYATGCAGDVTAGKYNDGSPANRPILAKRLLAAMQDAWQHTQRWPLTSVQLRTAEIPLKFRSDPAYTAAALHQALGDPKLDERARILAAMALASRQRLEQGRQASMSCLDFEHALLLSLPGESFVNYQLMAQRLRPDVPVLCSAYGECWPGYIPTRAAFADGFTDQWLWVAPGAEEAMRSSLISVLRTPFEPAAGKEEQDSSEITSDVFQATSEHPRYSEGSILPLADGSLLFAITEFDKDSSDFAPARIVARRSDDGGRQWSPLATLQDNVGRLNVMSATLRPFRGGASIGLFYLVKDGRDALKAYLRTSQDNGQTFGEPILITDAPGYHVMNNDRVTELADGRLLCPVAWTRDVSAENRFVSYCYWSDDDGKTWKTGASRVDAPQRGAMEPEVLELSDGRVLMIVRTQLGQIYASYSVDRGESWSPAQAWGVSSPESPATLRRIPATGDLLLIWNPTYVAGAGHGGKRTPLAAAVSTDEGRSWKPPRMIEDKPGQEYAYASVAFTGQQVLLSYYVAENSTGRISTRYRALPLRWFYAPADLSSK
jgi:hypothetical protein